MTKGYNINLLTAIRSVGLTQKEIAEQVGVDDSRVSRWIHNKNLTPQLRHREALVRILGRDVYAESK